MKTNKQTESREEEKKIVTKTNFEFYCYVVCPPANILAYVHISGFDLNHLNRLLFIYIIHLYGTRASLSLSLSGSAAALCVLNAFLFGTILGRFLCNNHITEMQFKYVLLLL